MTSVWHASDILRPGGNDFFHQPSTINPPPSDLGCAKKQKKLQNAEISERRRVFTLSSGTDVVRMAGGH
jgi:hypothetical protein